MHLVKLRVGCISRVRNERYANVCGASISNSGRIIVVKDLGDRSFAHGKAETVNIGVKLRVGCISRVRNERYANVCGASISNSGRIIVVKDLGDRFIAHGKAETVNIGP